MRQNVHVRDNINEETGGERRERRTQNKRKQGSEGMNEYSMNVTEYNCSLSQNGARYESGMREEFAFAFLSTVHVGMSVDYNGLLVCLGFKCKID